MGLGRRGAKQITLPANGVRLSRGKEPVTQAPTLREITSDEGVRVAVLDMILEVPASYVSPLEQERRVLGLDWGVQVADHGLHAGKGRRRRAVPSGEPSGVPGLREAWMAGKRGCAGKLTVSKPAMSAMGTLVTQASSSQP